MWSLDGIVAGSGLVMRPFDVDGPVIRLFAMNYLLLMVL